MSHRNLHRPRPAFLIVMLVPVIAAVIVASVLLAQSMMDGPEPIPTAETTPESTSAANLATPDSETASPESASDQILTGSLSDLMRYAPDRLADGSLPLPDVASYTDITGWLANQGRAPGTLTEADASDLALPPVLAGRGLDAVWRTTYGFSLADVDQILAVGQAPDYVMILRGRFDSDALMAAWTSGAYQAVAMDGTTVWSVYPFFTDTIDLSNPASRPAMGSLNNLVLLEDGTLIATSKLTRLKDVLRVIRGDASSMAANADIAQLLTLENSDRSFVSAIIAKGELLELAPTDTRSAVVPDVLSGHDAELMATPGADNMPQTRMCLFGLMVDRRGSGVATPEATPAAGQPTQVTIALVLTDGAVATEALDVIQSRFENELSSTTQQTYASLWSLTPDDETAASGTLVMDIAPKSGSIDWIQLVDDRDFGFLTWADDDD